MKLPNLSSQFTEQFQPLLRMASPIIGVYSLEEAHELVNQWVEGLGFGFGAVSVRNYVEYKIEPLVDLSVGGKM
jgi:hypothetical protein